MPPNRGRTPRRNTGNKRATARARPIPRHTCPAHTGIPAARRGRLLSCRVCGGMGATRNYCAEHGNRTAGDSRTLRRNQTRIARAGVRLLRRHTGHGRTVRDHTCPGRCDSIGRAITDPGRGRTAPGTLALQHYQANLAHGGVETLRRTGYGRTVRNHARPGLDSISHAITGRSRGRTAPGTLAFQRYLAQCAHDDEVDPLCRTGHDRTVRNHARPGRCNSISRVITGTGRGRTAPDAPALQHYHAKLAHNRGDRRYRTGHGSTVGDPARPGGYHEICRAIAQ